MTLKRIIKEHEKGRSFLEIASDYRKEYLETYNEHPHRTDEQLAVDFESEYRSVKLEEAMKKAMPSLSTRTIRALANAEFHTKDQVREALLNGKLKRTKTKNYGNKGQAEVLKMLGLARMPPPRKGGAYLPIRCPHCNGELHYENQTHPSNNFKSYKLEHPMESKDLES